MGKGVREMSKGIYIYDDHRIGGWGVLEFFMYLQTFFFLNN